MAAGLPDLVDCARLAADAAVLHRSYELAALPRLTGVLAEPVGMLNATFAFATLSSGRRGAQVSIVASPQLVCQRCMLEFGLSVSGGSAVEFSESDDADVDDGEHEFYRMQGGQVSLRELAEEELLLALPIAPKCSIPLTCGKAPDALIGPDEAALPAQMRRPFSALQDLLKKT